MASLIVESGVTSTGLVASGTWQEASYIYVRGGTVIETEVDHLGLLHVSNGGVAYDTVVNHSGEVDISSGGYASGMIVNDAALVTVYHGGEVVDTEVNYQGILILTDGAIASGNTVNSHGDLFVRSGAIAIDNYIDEYAEVFVADGGVVIDNLIDLRGIMHVSGGGVASNNSMSSHGELHVSDGGSAIHTHVGSSSYMAVYSNGWIGDTTISGGGYLELQSGARTGDRVTLDFTGVSAGPLIYQVLVNDLSLISSDTEICVTGMMTGKTFTLSPVGTDREVICLNGLYSDVVSSGGSYTNPVLGVSYSYDGATITTTSKAIAPVDIAMPLVSRGEVVNDTDLAARWTGTTQYSSSVYLTYGMTDSGYANGWLEIDGTNVNTALYGTSGGFAGTINWNIKSGTIRNLAAGADAGGSAGAVNLTIGGGDFTGVVYAGGFGNVGGRTATLISDGLFRKDFYAGALANKLAAATGVGNVSLTVDGGTFGGNIYGASSVKTVGIGGGIRHTAGDVTLTIAGGETTNGDFCLFSGGYATGTASGTVYTVDSVSATIAGGSWGEATNGRGVFGGIMASGVAAEVLGDVNLTISGGTMGNVFGGGWAQKNGTSTVGNVNISIQGGNITNVLGGGSHSTSGGSTAAGDVTITVSGGSITGAIYARGRLEGNYVGNAEVIFTGGADFGCGVFGYNYASGEAGDAALSFSGYTGDFSGDIGGFRGIAFDGLTAMTLATAANDVSNGKWEFDLTDRADTLAGTSLLTWSGADFGNDTIRVSFADDAQAQGSWNIAAVAEAFSETSFDVEIGGAEIASGLAYKEQIADGDYTGWGFELDDGVLKFKDLASA